MVLNFLHFTGGTFSEHPYKIMDAAIDVNLNITLQQSHEYLLIIFFTFPPNPTPSLSLCFSIHTHTKDCISKALEKWREVLEAETGPDCWVASMTSFNITSPHNPVLP